MIDERNFLCLNGRSVLHTEFVLQCIGRIRRVVACRSLAGALQHYRTPPAIERLKDWAIRRCCSSVGRVWPAKVAVGPGFSA
jgi:hypothetical protein